MKYIFMLLFSFDTCFFILAALIRELLICMWVFVFNSIDIDSLITHRIIF